MYSRLQEEAEDQGVSVAQFAREAAITRAAIHAHRRGMRWGADDDWSYFAQLIEQSTAGTRGCVPSTLGPAARRAGRTPSLMANPPHTRKVVET